MSTCHQRTLRTPVHVLNGDGRGVVTIADLDLDGGEAASNHYGTIDDLADEDGALLRTYPSKQAAVTAGRWIACPAASSCTAPMGQSKRPRHKRRHHQISVSGRQDFDVAGPAYSH